jgi:uncharacterized SAM-binding protein YcdF (DUF218 family)
LQKSSKRYTEAERMKEYLKEKGVEEDDILIENKSKDTFWNLTYSKAVIDRMEDIEQITVISSDYHIPRVKYL